MIRALRRTPWWVAVFLVALALRVGFLFVADEPLLYDHPYNYFNGGLSIVEHPDPWGFVLRSDRWHAWLGPWTIAPLYYLFVAAVFGVLGPHLLALQALQCVFDSLTAAIVGYLGREVAGSRGAWAGVAYALYWPAVELPTQTLTENLHTVLLVGGVALLAREAARAAERPDRPSLAAAGVLLGLSALARSVSTVFIGLAALWRLRLGGRRVGLGAAGAFLLGAASAVLPWTARNVFVIGDFVPVETVGVYNVWDDNCLVQGEQRRRQEHVIAQQPSLSAQRAQALKLAWRGVSRDPVEKLERAWRNLWHLVRPEGLHLLLVVEHPQTPWRHAAFLALDDGLLVGAAALFVVFVLAGRASPARTLVLLWSFYYVFMIVVVFHNESRYRATLAPFAFAGAAGGWSVLADREARRRLRVRVAAALGVVFVARPLAPYPALAWRAVGSTGTARSAAAAVHAGDLAGAETLAFEAVSEDPGAARPWLVYGRALAATGRASGAAAAYERARERKPAHWAPIMALPRLLAEAGRADDAGRALRAADELSRTVDAWQALEVAWRELPPPRADEVLLARGDYGAVRGFFDPHRTYRWSRHRALLRLAPTTHAPAYDVTLEMSTPEPSPYEAMDVVVRVAGGTGGRFTVGRETRAFTLRTPAPAVGVLMVQLDAPTWCRVGHPAEQGVRVDRMTVTPARDSDAPGPMISHRARGVPAVTPRAKGYSTARFRRAETGLP